MNFKSEPDKLRPAYNRSMMELNTRLEAAQIKKLSRGDVNAFNQLYHNHSKKLLRNVFYQVKDQEMAKDITQEVFIILWKNREYVDPARPLKPYLNVIVKYLIINAYRKMAGSQKVIRTLLIRAVDFYTHAEEDLDYKDTLALVEKAIATLSPQKRAIYRKCRLEGKSHEEIAGELGISKATVNNHMVKANLQIIAYLNKYDSIVILIFMYVTLSR